MKLHVVRHPCPWQALTHGIERHLMPRSSATAPSALVPVLAWGMNCIVSDRKLRLLAGLSSPPTVKAFFPCLSPCMGALMRTQR